MQTIQIHVWRSLGEPGEYGLALDREHRDFQLMDWECLGLLEAVAMLPDFAKALVRNFQFSDGSQAARLDRHGSFHH